MPNLERGRIIPALAGNTISWSAGRRVRTDHPRSRGEYRLVPCVYEGEDGSSPLSRGIPRQNTQPEGLLRIIPALAGNTTGGFGFGGMGWDHPRSRGEYGDAVLAGVVHVGSSPLSRGIRIRRHPHRQRRGIIPALAGNTDALDITGGYRTDHPRSRGEYWQWLVTLTSSTGSSPLSRGIPTSTKSVLRSPRIIPALAGNTSSCGASC